MKIRTITLILGGISLSILNSAFAQKHTNSQREQYYRIMFYNTENLYDPFNDSLVQDEEFLPDGIRHWTYTKFKQKLNHLAKVIIALGEWEPPAIIGLCEVENRFVSGKLARDTPLKPFHYQVVHEESQDPRGVDVVLMYREDLAREINHRKIRIVFPTDSNQHTRDILYVKLLLANKDTLHVFVNHWPSKFGGLASSESRREVVATTLRKTLDSLLCIQPSALIVMMGDLNATPEENCIVNFMEAPNQVCSKKESSLVNLTQTLSKDEGTHKFQGEWASIDQFIVSKAFYMKTSGLRILDGQMHIYRKSFLLEKDEANMGFRPFRTFLGPAYQGGFSDHLPVFIDLGVNINLEASK